jgi:predicted O-linked N-acetylglucosamine transferase (SPINDLY family)
MGSRSASTSLPTSQRRARAQTLLQQGLTHHQQGRLLEAQVAYKQVLTLQSGHFDALHLLGVTAYQLHEPAQARQLIRQAIEINPSIAAAHNNLGNALRDLREFDAALASYDRAIALQPGDAITLNNRGNALFDLLRFDAALESYDRALELQPAYAEAHNNRGNALRALGRYEAALASFERALAIAPGYADAYVNRGGTLQEQGCHAEAVLSYDRALAMTPGSVQAHRQRGVSLDHLRRHEAALASYGVALQLAPSDADSYNARGNAHRALKDFRAALADYARAIELRPNHTEAYFNRAATLDQQRDFAGAVAGYGAVLAMQPDRPYVLGLRLHAQRQICDWDEEAGRCAELTQRLTARAKVAMPFHAVTLLDSPAAQRHAAEIWIEDQHPTRGSLAPCSVHNAAEKIRVGYFSADFHEHATSYLIAGLMEKHDRRRFDVTGFSFGPRAGDVTSRRMAAAFDGFVDVRARSEREIAILSRERGIDIAVDLKGFTGDNRFDIFAHRAAPVQVSYLGYPGTSGAPYIDYLVADATVIPPSARPHYSEKIVYLPHSYQANDASRQISDRQFTREEMALPACGFVFCCFNNNFKIVPDVFSGWMRILTRVDGSVLWLLADNALAAANLRKEAARRGVDPARLVFAERMPIAEHLARQRLADLFLDTAPCNAHTTASDALWAGLPVLTLMTQTFAGRVAASLLNAVGLPELVTTSQRDYEATAIELATNPPRLASFTAKLGANRRTAPLFDTASFTAHLERAYTQIFERHQAGQPPADVAV